MVSHQFLGLCSYSLLMQFTGHSCWEARGKLSCLGSGCEAGIVHCPEQTEPVLAHAQAVRKVWFLSVCDFILMELLLGESTYLGQIFIWHFGLLFFGRSTQSEKWFAGPRCQSFPAEWAAVGATGETVSGETRALGHSHPWVCRAVVGALPLEAVDILFLCMRRESSLKMVLLPKFWACS